jgi:carboxylesterase
MFPLKVFQQPEHKAFVYEGGRPAALLIHGFPGTPAENRPIAGALNAAGWTASGILLPGFGPEIEILPQKTQQDWIAAVQKSIDELNADYGPVICVGFSIGGALALIGAATRKVNGLVLLAPYWRLDTFLWNIFPLFRFFVTEIKPFRLIKPDFQNLNFRAGIENLVPGADLDDPGVQDAIRNFVIPTSIFTELRETGKLAAKLASKINLPTLIIQGNKDRVVTPKMTRRLAKQIPGAVTYCEVDGEHDLLDPHKPAFQTITEAIIDFTDSILENSE